MILLLLLSCLKQVDLKTGLDPNDCFSSLETKLREAGCDQLSYVSSDGRDYMIRCYKDNDERNSVWDTYIFRMVYADAPIHHASKQLLDDHMICKDDKWRIEAYPPKVLK